MDVDWAKHELGRFITLTEPRPIEGVITTAMSTVGSDDAIVSAAQVVEQILDRALGGDWREAKPSSTSNRWVLHRESAQRALAQLQRQEELRERLGDAAPQLDANRLHPWVWQGARSLWQSRHYAEAVRAAAVKVNAEAQNKLQRRDVSETDRFNEAFSVDPPKPGRPRLRLSEDDGSKTFRSLHRGAMAFAKGCYAALRNPGSHDPQDDLPEHEALEQLAALSVLARWVDRASVVR